MPDHIWDVGGDDRVTTFEGSRRQTLANEEARSASRLRLRRQLRLFAKAAAILLIFGGIVTFSGSYRGIGFFGNWFPGGESVANLSSLLFSASGVALLLWSPRRLSPMRRTVAKMLGAFVFLGGVIPLLSYFTGGNSGFEILIFNSPADARNQIAPFSAIALMLQGLALLLLDRIYSRRNHPSEFFALLAGLLAFVSLLSYTYGSQTSFVSILHGEMALITSVLMLLLTFGIIVVRPVGLVGSLLTSTGMAGFIVRRMILALVLAPAIVGWLRLLGETKQWYSPELGAALAAGAYILFFGMMILRLGWLLQHTEQRRRRAEARVRMQEFDARIAFDYAPRGFCLLDEMGHWIRFNNQFCDMFGYTPEEFQKLTYHDIVHPEDLDGAEKLFFQLIDNIIEQMAVEIRYVKKDGTTIWCSVTITGIRDIPHSSTKAVGVIEDITERRNAQQELNRQKAAAEEANAAKDRLLSVISHELRTPLTPILAAITAYPTEQLSEEQKKTTAMIRRNIEHEVCLIDDLLDLTRVTHGKLRIKRVPVDLHALISEVFESVRPSLDGKGLSSRLILSASRHTVRGDPARLRQILINLLDNAKKFTPAGGYITVATSTKGNRIATRITDTGIGMEPKVLARIFGAFEQGEQTVQRQFGGLGLGLSISKGLAEAHGGVLRAESLGPGRGSTFTLELNLVDQPIIQPSQRQAPESQGVNVLLVEDHEDTRVILQRLLERRGHHVVSASSVASAIEQARQQAPDILVSDIGLPDGSGLSLPAAIQRECGHPIPGIALSGFGAQEDIATSARAGFSRHLTKPVEIGTLIEAIQQSVSV